jgi:CRISPR-associated protein Cas1
MSYHVVTVESPKAVLDCAHGQFFCSTAEGTRQLPLDDIAAIIVCCFSAKIEMRLLVEAAKRGIGLVLCERFSPVALMLPADRATDTLLTRAWQAASAETLAALWRKTLDAKCANQETLASYWQSDHPALAKIRSALPRHFPAKEAAVAKLYWHVFRDAAGQPDFARKRGDGEINACLDYGYAVLLARILQLCFACGLDPTFGIGHATAERSMPLAYDLMEPFRPLVDARLAGWVRQAGAPSLEDRNFKKFLLLFLEQRIGYLGRETPVQAVMERAVRSFRSALLRNEPEAYRPWMACNSKWAGS